MKCSKRIAFRLQTAFLIMNLRRRFMRTRLGSIELPDLLLLDMRIRDNGQGILSVGDHCISRRIQMHARSSVDLVMPQGRMKSVAKQNMGVKMDGANEVGRSVFRMLLGCIWNS